MLLVLLFPYRTVHAPNCRARSTTDELYRDVFSLRRIVWIYCGLSDEGRTFGLVLDTCLEGSKVDQGALECMPSVALAQMPGELFALPCARR